MPSTHPAVAPTISPGNLRPTHPNVDVVLANPASNVFPSWHPLISTYVAMEQQDDAEVVEVSDGSSSLARSRTHCLPLPHLRLPVVRSR